MAQIRNFMDLVVWQKAHRLFLEVVKDVEAFPSGLPGRVVADQLLRSSGSISANISEVLLALPLPIGLCNLHDRRFTEPLLPPASPPDRELPSRLLQRGTGSAGTAFPG